MRKCKITVLKTTLYEELSEKYGQTAVHEKCPVFQEGQTFITTGIFGNDIPEGFCSMAWQALVMPVNVLIGGGKVLGLDEKHIACCTDGVRPVIFLLEAIEEEEEEA